MKNFYCYGDIKNMDQGPSTHKPNSPFKKNYVLDKSTGILSLPYKYAEYNITLLNYSPLDYEENEITFFNKNNDNIFYKEKGIRYINFKDIQKYSIDEGIPLHVRDIFDIKQGTQYIQLKESQILANDLNIHNRTLHVRNLENFVGCNAIKDSNNIIKVYFYPSVDIASFQYTIEDSKGVINYSKVGVYFRSEKMPRDPQFIDQWYLQRSNIPKAWDLATGKNVTIAIFDSGLVPLHSDIINNLLSADEATNYQFGSENNEHYFHALGVAGTIAAERNDKNLVGVAYDSKIASYQINFSRDYNFLWFKDYDVINNSWGFPASLFISMITKQTNTDFIKEKIHNSYKIAVEDGRNGLGTSIIFACGNHQQFGFDANDNMLNYSPYVSVIGGFNKPLDQLYFEPLKEKFSTLGSLILVSAPASNFPTLHVENLKIDPNLKYTFDDTAKDVSGTSFAAPIVSGIIALMLEVNPKLGWRDIQEILVITAKKVDESGNKNISYDQKHVEKSFLAEESSLETKKEAISATSPKKEVIWKWETNKANNWNGGGMHYSREFGFGEVDAYAAVKTARNWLYCQTSKNMKTLTSSSPITLQNKYLREGTHRFNIDINDEIEVEYISLGIAAFSKKVSDYEIYLISPSGTRSVILYKPSIGNKDMSEILPSGGDFEAVLSSTNFRGEMSKGKWVIEVDNHKEFQTSFFGSNTNMKMLSFEIKIYGKEIEKNKTMYFTDEVRANQNPENEVSITLPKSKEFTTISAAAFSADVYIDLMEYSRNEIGKPLIFTSGHKFKNLISGDGSTVFIGNKDDNIFVIGRGERNIFTGNGGNDLVYISDLKNHKGETTITDFGKKNIKIQFGNNVKFSDLKITSYSKIAPEICIHSMIEGKNWKIILQDIKANDITQDFFIFDDLLIS